MAKMKAGTLNPKMKDRVTAAYKRGLTDGEKRKSFRCQNKVFKVLTRGLDPNTKEAVSASYELGIMDGEKRTCRQCRSERVSKLMTTNAELWENLNDLDKAEPLEAVTISFAEAEIIIASLRKGIRKVKLANILRYRVRQSPHTLHILLAKLEQSQ